MMDQPIFSLTGPTFLTAVDWSNFHHKRSICASLVQGVYSLEHDRRKNRQGDEALAPPWWEFFNFRLIERLVDDHDLSYFGAIYELLNAPKNHPQRPPRYVVAFRGTINKTGNREQDYKLNLHLIFNNLGKNSRFQIAFDCVRGIVQKVAPESVWIAGHSLGSSIALLVGKQMVKQTGIHLETYLFNPPFASPPIELLTNDKLKFGLRLANSVITAGLAAAASRKTKDQESDAFMVLSRWVPYLFINPLDPICSEYGGYFKHREDMESIGAGKIGKLATKHSIWSILSGTNDCEALHLIPCAYLTSNVTPAADHLIGLKFGMGTLDDMNHLKNTFKEAHGIDQWWRQDLQFSYKFHQYSEN